MRYSGTKEWIISDQPNPRKQSSNTEVFRCGLGTPEVPWNIFGRGVLQSQNYFYNSAEMLFAFSLFFFHVVFSRSYMIPASDSLTPARYPTTELSSDTCCQSWYGHHRLRIQSHKTAHFRCVPQMGSQVTHTSARLATDLGVPTTFPAPFDNSLEQLKKHKITLYLHPPVYYRAYNSGNRRDAQGRVQCAHLGSIPSLGTCPSPLW